jgi:hypothetical protein
MSCRCQRCGKQYKVDFIVEDDIWEEIKPKDKPEGGGLLCGRCIAELIEKRGDYDAFTVRNIKRREAN